MTVTVKVIVFWDVMLCSLQIPTFQKNLLPPLSLFSTLKLGATGSSEISVPALQATWFHVPEDCNLHGIITVQKN
jgi:hypothetical protein